MKRKMKSNKTIVIRIILIILSILLIAFILLGTIPLGQGKEIRPGAPRDYKHYNDKGFYRLVVTKGSYYTFSLAFTELSSFKPDIQLFSRSFKTTGIIAKSPSWSGYVYVSFQAEHDGHYYVTVANSQGGYFNVYLANHGTYSVSLTTVSYINPWKFALNFCLITGLSVGIVISGMIFYRKDADGIKERNMISCPNCKQKVAEETEYCKICGFTFKKPKDFDVS